MVIDSNKKLKHFYSKQFAEIRAKEELNLKTSKYFGEIGSIPIEDIPYEKQIEVKRVALKNTFLNKDLGLEPEIIENIEVVSSPVVSEYRLKMEYVASYDPFHEPQLRFGQRKKSNFSWVIDMDESSLIDNIWFTKLRKLYLKFGENDLGELSRNYDLVKQDGNLRYLVLRCQGEHAIVSIITKYSDSTTAKIVEDVAQEAISLGFESIYWNVNSSAGDRAEGELMKVWGNNEMTVEMYGYKFQINPQTFFQNNILGFEVLLRYLEETLVEFLKLKYTNENITTLYDLYSGVGTLGIIFSKYFKKVIGFDIVDESVELAKKNMQMNHISNYTISQADLNKPEEIDPRLIIKNQILIVDPPRIGLEKNGVKHILSLDPKIIIYISCNPITQVQDLIMLKDKYEVIHVKGFDLFPHTFHMENVVVLEKF